MYQVEKSEPNRMSSTTKLMHKWISMRLMRFCMLFWFDVWCHFDLILFIFLFSIRYKSRADIFMNGNFAFQCLSPSVVFAHYHK